MQGPVTSLGGQYKMLGWSTEHAVKLLANYCEQLANYRKNTIQLLVGVFETIMADDQQLPQQDETAQTSLTKSDIPALVKAVAEELGPRIDKVVPGKCCCIAK